MLRSAVRDYFNLGGHIRYKNLGTIGNGLVELRGLYGTGHGKHGTATGLSARHAKLAVGAASTLTVFLFATHTETKAR